MAKQNVAAGLLMCRTKENKLQFFLVHPGGPYYRNKHEGVWSIPKGMPESDAEEMLGVATREFEEETGIKPNPPFHSIGFTQQKAGKVVHAWCFIGQWHESEGIRSNTFSMEWPPRSGKFQEFPEVDEARWFSYTKALEMINPGQIVFLDRAKIIFNDTSHR